MKVIANSYKEKIIIGIIGASLFLAGSIVFIVLLILSDTNSDRIASSIVFSICFLVFIGILIPMILQKMRKDEIIIFNETNNTFIVNCYRKSVEIAIAEIKEVKCNTKGLTPLAPLLYFSETEFGRIVFILKDGSIIRTPMVDAAKDCYKKISVLLF